MKERLNDYPFRQIMRGEDPFRQKKKGLKKI